MSLDREIYDQREQRIEAAQRALGIRDEPLDGIVRALCEAHGYGAVMDSAARQWALKDSRGAFYIGGCLDLPSLADVALAAAPSKEPET